MSTNQIEMTLEWVEKMVDTILSRLVEMKEDNENREAMMIALSFYTDKYNELAKKEGKK